MALTDLLNLITANATQQGSSDRITGSEMRSILTSIVNTIQGDIAYSSVIPFDKLVSKMATLTLSGPVTLSKNTTGAAPGFGTILRVVGDGTHTPDLSAFKKMSTSGSYVATSGTENVFLFLYDGSDYWYSVFQEAGTSSGSTQLSAPVISISSGTATPVVLDWADVPNATQYAVQRASDASFSDVVTLAHPVTGSTYTDNSAAAGTTYYYRVKADAPGYTDSPYSNTASVTTAGSGATQLNTPGSFAATAVSSSQINLSWGDVANESSYLIEVSDNGTNGWSTLATPAAGSTSYQHTGLSASTTKYYRIRAVGDGTAYSDSAYASTNATTTAAAGYLTQKRITSELTYDGATGTLSKSGGGATDWYNELAANETLSVGESVVFQFPVITQSVYVALGTDANQPYFTTGGQANSLRYGLQTNGDGNIYEITNGAAPNNAPIANNVYLKIEYTDASTVKYYKSADGTSWTLMFTSPTGVIASSVFYIYAYIKTPGATITNLQRV